MIATAIPLVRTRTGISRRQGYALVLLVIVGVFAWMDRNVFAILLEAIRADLVLSDTQLGLVSGTAFGVLYAAVGLPLAWAAHSYDRRSTIAVALTIWSALTMLCGMAVGFTSLLAVRAGVAVSEAAGTPPAHSLVSDYFEPTQRGFALGVLYLYIPLSFLFGYLAAGWANEIFGWRSTFVIIGAPGVVVALILRLTLWEPRIGASTALRDSRPPFWLTLASFVRTYSLRHIPIAGCVYGIGAFAAAIWLPSYLARVHSLSPGEIGTWMALTYGFGGGLGTVVGGYVADRIVKRTGDVRWYAWVAAGSIAATAPLFAVVFLADNSYVMITALSAAALFGHIYLGPMTAMMQGVVRVHERAMVSAFYLFFANLIGAGLGPFVTGVVSDYFGQLFGYDGLRGALLAVVPTASAWASVHFLLVAARVRREFADRL